MLDEHFPATAALVPPGLDTAVVDAAAVDGDRGDTVIGGDASDGDTILSFRRDTGADLQGHGDFDRRRDGAEYARHERFVGEQSGTGVGVAYLLGGAAHVDVNDLGAALDAGFSRCCQLLRLGTGNLHCYRFRIEIQVQPMP